MDGLDFLLTIGRKRLEYLEDHAEAVQAEVQEAISADWAHYSAELEEAVEVYDDWFWIWG